MSRKIVAIGGGKNGRIGSDGIKNPYELANQDKEIIRITGKEHPNFLFIAHSQPIENQEGYFQVMVDIYDKMYGCSCKDLKSVKELIKTSGQIGLAMSNCTALEIIDDQYRLITSDASYYNIEAYGLKLYWKDEEYFEEKIDTSPEFKPLNDLFRGTISIQR